MLNWLEANLADHNPDPSTGMRPVVISFWSAFGRTDVKLERAGVDRPREAHRILQGKLVRRMDQVYRRPGVIRDQGKGDKNH